MANVYISLLCFLIFVNVGIEALKCYSCTYTNGIDIDQRCVTNPGAVEVGSAIINCNKQFCTSRRIEYKDSSGKVQSFYRGCEDNPANMNTIDDSDPEVTVYYQACTTDRCNGGNGKGTEAEGGIESDTGAVGNLLVPGRSSATQNILNTIIFGFILGVFYILY